jgi:hypothetical protein
MEVMTFKKFIKHYLLGESVKEIEMNRILDKVGKKKNLEDREKRFLDLYYSEDKMKDFLYLSREDAFKRVKDLIGKGETVICDLSDRDGKFGLKIVSIENYFTDDSSVIKMKGSTCKLEDKFLYNIIYDIRKNEYSLQVQNEFYEKIPVKDEN